MITADPSAPTTVALLAAGLGARHGYAIEGDSARLHADLVIYDLATASHHEWTLQLWVRDEPFTGGTLTGHKAAEVWIGSLAEFARAPATLHATTKFQPPSHGEFSLVLVLVATTPGGTPEIHSYANYPRRETFLLPRLRGKIGYQIDVDTVRLDVEAVENPRDASNLSGTLALELWALPVPYRGGHFSGAPLATAVLGTLAGQCEWNPPPFDLSLKVPPDGTWYFCLMLREWAGTGYTTRDYMNFAQPIFYQSPPPSAGESAPTAAPFTAESSTKAEPEAPPVSAKPRPAAKTKSAKAVPDTVLSINTASVDELAAIKGLPKATRAALMAARPFNAFDDLLQVKGVGPKLLARLKSALKL